MSLGSRSRPSTSPALRLGLAVALGAALAAPTAANPVPPAAALECYQSRVTKKTPAFVPRTATVADRIGPATTTVRYVRTLCNPASVDGGPIADPTATSLCYGTRDAAPLPRPFPVFQTTDAFGTLVLSLSKAERLCMPAAVDGVAPTPGLDAFRCYKARVKDGTDPFVPVDVTLSDAVETRAATATKPVLACFATGVDGDPAAVPDAARVCYRLADASPDPPSPRRDVTTADAFGALAVTARPQIPTLCLPATAEPPPTTTTTLP